MDVIHSNQRFKGDSKLYTFTNGVAIDARLAVQEVAVQKAWAIALLDAGLLKEAELQQLHLCLDQALEQMKTGQFEWRIEDEDIHMNLERFLTAQLGELGKRIHLGRSRNDLIATTLRLFVRDSIVQVQYQIKDLCAALVQRAQKDIELLVPGMTHLQNGQPIRHSQVLSAHAWGFCRDLSRMEDALKRVTYAMPLGSAALAGTTVAVDLDGLAKRLGFAHAPQNSYDSVGDRDFVVEALDAFASTAIHLSRLAEDCIIWSSTGFGLVRLPEEWSTGSSIMPNKRNPDVAELTRAKAAHIVSRATDAHVLLKGMPSGYSTDLHEIKQVFLQSFDELQACLGIFPSFVRRLEPIPARAEQLLSQGHVLATEIANELTRQGEVFREAYHQVAGLVAAAETAGISVEQLSQDQFKKLAPSLSSEFISQLSARSAVESRVFSGGTSKEQVSAGLAKLKEEIGI